MAENFWNGNFKPHMVKLPENRHTFLSCEGIWKSLGYYTGADGEIFTVEGESWIRKESSELVAEIKFSVISGSAMMISHKFKIVPEAGKDDTRWQTALICGIRMDGRIMYMNEFIFLLYQALDSGFSGVENLEMVSETHYKNHGYVFHHEKKIAAWVLDWHRVE